MKMFSTHNENPSYWRDDALKYIQELIQPQTSEEGTAVYGVPLSEPQIKCRITGALRTLNILTHKIKSRIFNRKTVVSRSEIPNNRQKGGNEQN